MLITIEVLQANKVLVSIDEYLLEKGLEIFISSSLAQASEVLATILTDDELDNADYVLIQ